jgi:dolichol-phosphate mannosyltransferase
MAEGSQVLSDAVGGGSSKTPLLSIVVPLYNEEEVLNLLYERLLEVLNPLGCSYEILMVDDGSEDRTRTLVVELHRRDPRVKLVALSRNHGQQLALSAGLAFSRGKAAITMDADLQHPPELIPQMLKEWQKGAEVVQMVRERQLGRSRLKSLAVAIFYRLFRRLSEVELQPNAADFRLLGPKALAALRSMPEKTRFLRGMTSWIGFRQVNLTYVAPPRAGGSAKYTARKMRDLAFGGILSFSTVPLRLAIYLGSLLAGLAMLYGMHAVVFKLLGYSVVPGFTDTLVAITGLAGLQLIFLGILGSYVARIFEEVKQRPLFVIDELLGIQEADDAGNSTGSTPRDSVERG